MVPNKVATSNTWQVFGASVRGASHLADGRPNQDAMASWPGDSAAVPVALVAIADGHGGARHFRSDVGSRIAVDVTVATLRALVPALDAATDGERSQLVAVDIPQRIVAAWTEAVRAHLAAHPITGPEWLAMETAEGSGAVEAVRADPLLAYGATLLASLATGKCVVITQLGDGDVLAVAADGSTTRPVPVDERLNGNLTTSICRAGAESDFRGIALPAHAARPALILLSTDGYANSFKSDADFLQVGRDFLRMITDDGIASVSAELPGILDHASQNGSGDDITLALLRCPDVAYVPAAAGASIAQDPPAASGPGQGTEALAKLDQRLQDAEKRIGSLRRITVVACLVALAVVGWSFRQRIMELVAAPPSIATGTVPPGAITPASPKHPRAAPDGGGQPGLAPSLGDPTKGPGLGEPTKGPGLGDPATVGVTDPGAPVKSSATPPVIEDVVALREERGVDVNALVVFPGPEPTGCTAEATVWDAKKHKIGSASVKLPRVADNAAPTIPLKLLIAAGDAAHAKSLQNADATATVTLSCEGKLVAESDRQAVGS
jgi:hypothetical protein